MWMNVVVSDYKSTFVCQMQVENLNLIKNILFGVLFEAYDSIAP